MDDEINIIDYIRVVYKRKWIIFILSIIGASIMYFQNLSTPKLYKAEVTLLTLGSGMGNLPSLSSFGFGGGAGGDQGNVAAILKSRALARTIAEDGSLKTVIFKKNFDAQNNIWIGKEPSQDEVVDAIRGGASEFDPSKIQVIWDDPEIAAFVANAYSKGLITFLNRNSMSVNIKVLDEARAPKAPFNKKGISGAFPGAIIGMFIGVFFAFISEYFNKIKRSKIFGK